VNELIHGRFDPSTLAADSEVTNRAHVSGVLVSPTRRTFPEVLAQSDDAYAKSLAQLGVRHQFFLCCFWHVCLLYR
jgi:hypothetical protein